jgi:S1-C subfamily serine protease
MKRNLSVYSKWSWISLLVITTISCGSFVPYVSQSSNPANPKEQVQSVQVVAQPTPTLLIIPQAVTDEQAVLVNLYDRVNPAVVNITDYSSQQGQVLPLGKGSGFLYDDSGHIVTNEHVVIDSDQLDVTFSDGTVLAAKIIGEDLNSDLAVIKVERVPEGVSPLPLGDLEKVAVGQTVVAIGNPFGLEGTLTRGIVSALGRTIPALTQFSIPLSIQTDAAINPGNSGGPLLDLQGEVIGVNAQIETGGTNTANSGVGFAIPVNIVKLVVPDLIEKGKHEWAWLGVRGGSLTPTLVEANNLPVEKGAYITDVISGGPSEKAGLQGSSGTKTVSGRDTLYGGDVVTAINGVAINSFDDLLIYISLQSKPGDEVVLTIIHNGKTSDLKVVLEPRPASISG